MLGIGRTRTLQRLIDDGHLKIVMVGRRARVPLAEVQRFCQEGERPAALPPARPPRRQAVLHPLQAPAAKPGSLAAELAKVRAIKV